EHAARFSDVRGVPNVAWVDGGLPFGEIDPMFNTVAFLHEGHAPGDDDDELLSSWMPFPRRPARVTGTDHHQPALGTVGAVLGSVLDQKIRAPLEVRNWNRSRAQPEMYVGCREIEA